VRFNLTQRTAAREAAEKAPRERYVEKVAASDNLRWTLSDEASSAEPPLGRSTAAARPAGGTAN
jgi:hypothetical protein